MSAFLKVWFGEFVSLIGSNLTRFALGIWVYQRTGSATQFALISLFNTLPYILVSPLAGALVDRWDRRRVMLFADLVAGLGTLAIAVLLRMDRLEVWHIYGVTALGALASAFQVPAYTAATSLLVPKDQLGRASGLVQVAQGLSQIVAPITAGFLLLVVNIQGIILIDFATFLFAVLMLTIVHFPKVGSSLEGRATKGSMLGEVIYGWKYLWVRRGLFAMLCLFATINFSLGIITALFTPMMLTITSSEWLGVTLTVAGVGMLIGSIVMSAWGGPKRRINGLFAALVLAGIAVFMVGLRPSVPLIMASAFLFFFALPFANGMSQVIWQSKVAPDVQGRVFATRDMISMSMQPLAFLVAGSLADKIFEPLMAANGLLANSMGQWIGVGAGRGIGLMFSVMGLLIIAATIVSYFYPRLARVEDELPDALPASEEQVFVA